MHGNVSLFKASPGCSPDSPDISGPDPRKLYFILASFRSVEQTSNIPYEEVEVSGPVQCRSMTKLSAVTDQENLRAELNLAAKTTEAIRQDCITRKSHHPDTTRDPGGPESSENYQADSRPRGSIRHQYVRIFIAK
jgi:hypothetical protein